MTSKVRLPAIIDKIGNEDYGVKRPSIIAHRKSKKNLEQKDVDPLLNEEIDQVLCNNFQVRNGFLVHTNQFVAPSVPVGTIDYSPKKLVFINPDTSSGASTSAWKSRSLPGTADEVESYPCRVCNRVFLTSRGLESHASEEHLNSLHLIKDDIIAISAEWRRRERIVKRVINPVVRNRRNMVLRQRSPGIYEMCQTCNLAIKMDLPDAMDRHLLKHKNGIVLTDMQCDICCLYFGSHDSYTKHMSIHKKKHYVCRNCEAKFVNYFELRKHNQDIHGDVIKGMNDSSTINISNTSDKADANVRAKCRKCGLVLQKPELLIKHYHTVHQESSFTAEIAIRGMPEYLIIVKQFNVHFQCCDTVFNNRADFASHRSLHDPDRNLS